MFFHLFLLPLFFCKYNYIKVKLNYTHFEYTHYHTLTMLKCEHINCNVMTFTVFVCIYLYIIDFIFFNLLSPCPQRFSCIIGPNGSGKSNVIDSMLFVFGYRAQKIRSKKLSVLIHSSDKHKDVQSCTVEVHFQKIIDKVYISSSLSHRYTLHSLWPRLN